MPPEDQDYDQMFLQMMVMHHHMAVMMSQPVKERSLHPQVAQLADDIITSQSAEMAQMQSWLWDWYGVEMPMPMDHSGMGHTGRMGGMGQMDSMADMGMMMVMMMNLPPHRMEAVYLSLMVPHHQEAVMMAQEAQMQAVHPEVRELASHIIASQSAEIQQMNDWLALWYGL